MKLTTICALLLAITSLIGCVSISTGKNVNFQHVENNFVGQSHLKIDQIAFSADDALSIKNDKGETLCTFKKIPNLNYEVPGFELYSKSGRKLYSIIPFVKKPSTLITFQNDKKETGQIEIIRERTAILGYVDQKYIINADLFNKPVKVDIHSYIEASIMLKLPNEECLIETIIYYKNQPVITSLVSETGINIIAESTFEEEDPETTCLLALYLNMLHDVNTNEEKKDQLLEAARRYRDD